MKYVYNKGRYAQSFTISVQGKERKIAFDRRRFYFDTGNIATTGITEVEDNIYEILLENKRFSKLIAEGEFELTEASKLNASERINEELKKENKELKKEVEEIIKEKESLKAQLEILSKKGKKTNAEVN